MKKGELIAVVGPVGSGKSSLLAACLGEMETVTGDVNLNVSKAFPDVYCFRQILKQ